MPFDRQELITNLRDKTMSIIDEAYAEGDWAASLRGMEFFDF